MKPIILINIIALFLSYSTIVNTYVIPPKKIEILNKYSDGKNINNIKTEYNEDDEYYDINREPDIGRVKSDYNNKDKFKENYSSNIFMGHSKHKINNNSKTSKTLPPKNLKSNAKTIPTSNDESAKKNQEEKATENKVTNNTETSDKNQKDKSISKSKETNKNETVDKNQKDKNDSEKKEANKGESDDKNQKEKEKQDKSNKSTNENKNTELIPDIKLVSPSLSSNIISPKIGLAMVDGVTLVDSSTVNLSDATTNENNDNSEASKNEASNKNYSGIKTNITYMNTNEVTNVGTSPSGQDSNASNNNTTTTSNSSVQIKSTAATVSTKTTSSTQNTNVNTNTNNKNNVGSNTNINNNSNNANPNNNNSYGTTTTPISDPTKQTYNTNIINKDINNDVNGLNQVINDDTDHLNDQKSKSNNAPIPEKTGLSFTNIILILIVLVSITACAIMYIKAYYNPSKKEDRQPKFYLDGTVMNQDYINGSGPFETSPFIRPNMNAAPYTGSDFPTMSSSSYSNSRGGTMNSHNMLPYPNSQYGTIQSQYHQNSPLLPQSSYLPYQSSGNNNIYYNKNTYDRQDFKNQSDYFIAEDYGNPNVDIEPGQDFNQQNYSHYRNERNDRNNYDYDYVDYSKKIE